MNGIITEKIISNKYVVVNYNYEIKNIRDFIWEILWMKKNKIKSSQRSFLVENFCETVFFISEIILVKYNVEIHL